MDPQALPEQHVCMMFNNLTHLMFSNFFRSGITRITRCTTYAAFSDVCCTQKTIDHTNTDDISYAGDTYLFGARMNMREGGNASCSSNEKCF